MRYTSETTFDEMVADIEGMLPLDHFTSKQQSKDVIGKVNDAFGLITKISIHNNWDYTNVTFSKEETHTYTRFDDNGNEVTASGKKVYINKILAFYVREDATSVQMFSQNYIHEVKDKHLPLYKFFGYNVNNIKVLMELRDKIKSFEIIKPIAVKPFEKKLSNYLHTTYKDRVVPEKLTVTDIFKTKDGHQIPLFKEHICVIPHGCQNVHGTRWWRFNWYIDDKLVSMQHVQVLIYEAKLQFKNGDKI